MAKKSETVGEVPIAAGIFDDSGSLLAMAHNMVESLDNPTMHAEMIVINEVCRSLKTKNLDQYHIYVTLEPCAMCLQALCFARIKTIYFGAYDEKNGGISKSNILTSSMNNYIPEIYGGIAEEKASKLLKDFFRAKR